MKKINKYVSLFVAVVIAFTLVGCTSDDDIGISYSDYQNFVVGEWYVEVGDNRDFKQRIVFEFTQDGYFCLLNTGVTVNNSYYDEGEGTYSVNGNKLNESFIINGVKNSAEYEIRSVNKYDMHLFLKANQQEETDYRIVETIQMKEGDTHNVSINDPDFYPDEYVSDDDLVAKVDNTGKIQAVRQGTAYILIHSSIGTAVIRVVVETESYIDDYVKYMGEHISAPTKAYGNIYHDAYYEEYGSNIRAFYLQEDKVDIVSFYYNKDQIVEGVVIGLRELTDIEKIRYAFCRSYEYIDTKDGIQNYSTIKNARKIFINFNESTGNIVYYYESTEEPFKEANDYVKHLASMSAAEIAAECGVAVEYLQLLQLVFGYVEFNVSDVFPQLHIIFDWDKGKISKMRLYPRKDITFESIDAWYRQNYILTGYDELGSYMYRSINPEMFIGIDQESDSSYYVFYDL